MTFYLIGLGLDAKSLSIEALEICSKADKIYIENYTVEYPYPAHKLQEIVGRIYPLSRKLVEEEKFISEAENKNIVLLVYGSPLIATTHISLILKCKELGIEYKIFHNASVFDAVCETGLQFYKFGKTASMPAWTENHKPDSFIKILQDNKKIKAHTLILVDIGLSFPDALEQLKEACRKKVKLEKIIVCSQIGTKNSRIYYSSIEDLYGKEVYAPFCFIIPGELHFLEKEVLDMMS